MLGHALLPSRLGFEACLEIFKGCSLREEATIGILGDYTCDGGSVDSEGRFAAPGDTEVAWLSVRGESENPTGADREGGGIVAALPSVVPSHN